MYFNFRFLLLVLIALAVGIYLQIASIKSPVGTVANPPDIEGFFWPDQKRLAEFEMVDTNNQPFGIADLSSKWSFVFFGYTHCPDICPITMHTMRKVRDKIYSYQEINMKNFNILFVSVDSERDTPEHLGKYISFFGDNFSAVTGNKKQVDSLTGQLGVPYSIDKHEPEDTDYLVGHSGAIFLISPDGYLASIYQPPHGVEEITSRFMDILRFHKNQS